MRMNNHLCLLSGGEAFRIHDHQHTIIIRIELLTVSVSYYMNSIMSIITEQYLVGYHLHAISVLAGVIFLYSLRFEFHNRLGN